MNDVTLIGNITKDVEVQYTESKIPVSRFTVAINNGKNDKGEDRPADFINCVIWEKQAENMAKYTKKGSKVAVKGRIKNDNYDDGNGVRHYRTYVLANRVMFLDSKSSGQPLPTAPDYIANHSEESIDDPYQNFSNSVEIGPEDLPF